MNHDTTNHTSLKEIEQELFGRLQHYFHVVFKGLLEDMDGWIMENRDHGRCKYKEKRHPRSKDYDLMNKSFYYSLENGESFWEGFSKSLYEQYDIQEDTPIVINGDGAPWIRGAWNIFRKPSIIRTVFIWKSGLKWLGAIAPKKSGEKRM